MLPLLMALPLVLLLNACAYNGSRPQIVAGKSLGVDLQGHPVSTMQYRDRVLVVAFWVSWAGPCRLLLSDLDSLQSEFDNRISVVAVNNREERESVVRFLNDRQLDLQVTIDPEGSVMSSFTTSRALPTTLVLDDHATMHSEHRGYLAGSQDIRSSIVDLIGEP